MLALLCGLEEWGKIYKDEMNETEDSRENIKNNI